jgi:hypothetical protein
VLAYAQHRRLHIIHVLDKCKRRFPPAYDGGPTTNPPVAAPALRPGGGAAVLLRSGAADVEPIVGRSKIATSPMCDLVKRLDDCSSREVTVCRMPKVSAAAV